MYNFIPIILIYSLLTIGGFFNFFVESGHDFYDFLSFDVDYEGSFLLLLLSLSFCLSGFYFYHRVLLKRNGFMLAKYSSKQLDVKSVISSKFNYLFLFGFVTFLIYFVSYGMFCLSSRYGYEPVIPAFFDSFKTITSFLGLISLIILCVSLNASDSARVKVLIVFLILVLMLCFFSKATRIFGVGYLIYSLALIFSQGKVTKITGYVLLLFTPWMFGVSLTLRNELVQGAVPFLHLLTSEKFSLSISDSYLNLIINFGSGFYIFTETLVSANWLTFDDMLVSLSPLSGDTVGWNNVYADYRVNSVIPYSSMGELYAFSAYVGHLFSFLLGCLIASVCELKRKNFILGVLCYLLLVYCCFLIPQYNLRSVMRFIYLIVFIIISFKVIELMKLSRKFDKG